MRLYEFVAGFQFYLNDSAALFGGYALLIYSSFYRFGKLDYK